jgi:hypothetical protein
MPARPTRLYHKIENSELAERKVTACADRNVRATGSDYALTTLPLRRQAVQTRMRLLAPFTLA